MHGYRQHLADLPNNSMGPSASVGLSVLQQVQPSDLWPIRPFVLVSVSSFVQLLYRSIRSPPTVHATKSAPFTSLSLLQLLYRSNCSPPRVLAIKSAPSTYLSLCSFNFSTAASSHLLQFSSLSLLPPHLSLCSSNFCRPAALALAPVFLIV